MALPMTVMAPLAVRSNSYTRHTPWQGLKNFFPSIFCQSMDLGKFAGKHTGYTLPRALPTTVGINYKVALKYYTAHITVEPGG